MTNAQNGVTSSRTAFSRDVGGGGRRGADLVPDRRGGGRSPREPCHRRFRLGRDMSELAQLDARALQDVGVTHADFAAIREGRFERANVLSEERIIFNPEAGREAAGKPEAADFFRPFGPDAQWYPHCWFGD